MKVVTHQFTLFGFNAMKPKVKVPISKARIKQVQALMQAGHDKDAVRALRELRYKLEDFESRL